MSHNVYFELPNGKKVKLPTKLDPATDMLINVIQNFDNPDHVLAQTFKNYLKNIPLPKDYDPNKVPDSLEVVDEVPEEDAVILCDKSKLSNKKK